MSVARIGWLLSVCLPPPCPGHRSNNYQYMQLMLVEQCAKRQDLLNVALMKCLAFSPYLASIVALIQEQTNSLHKLAAKNMMSTMSGMQNAGLGDEEEDRFGAKSLFSLFDFACQKLGWNLESGSRAPGVDRDKFVALLTVGLTH